MNRYFVLLTVTLLSTTATAPLKAMDDMEARMEAQKRARIQQQLKEDKEKQEALLAQERKTGKAVFKADQNDPEKGNSIEEQKRARLQQTLKEDKEKQEALLAQEKKTDKAVFKNDQNDAEKGDALVHKTKECHKKAKQETIEATAKKRKEEHEQEVRNILCYKNSEDGTKRVLRPHDEVKIIEENLPALIKMLRKQEKIACGSMEQTLYNLAIQPFDQMCAQITKLKVGTKAFKRLKARVKKDKREKKEEEEKISTHKTLQERIYDKIKKFAYEERIKSDDPTFGDIVNTIHFFNDVPRSYLGGKKLSPLEEALRGQNLKLVYEHLDIHPESPVGQKKTAEALAARKAVEILITTKETGIVFLPTARNAASSNNALIKLLRGRSGTTHYFFYNAKNLDKNHSGHDLYKRIQNDEFILVTSTAVHAHFIFAMPRTEGDILHLCATAKGWDPETQKQIIDIAILEWYPESPEAQEIKQKLGIQRKKQKQEAKDLERLQAQGDLMGELMGRPKDPKSKTVLRKRTNLPHPDQDSKKKANSQPIETITKKVKISLNPTGLAQNIETQKNGAIKVITDNNNWASYQLTSERFDIVPGQKISVPYNVSVEEGGLMSIGLLNTTESGWLNEIVLKAGENQAGVMEAIVPKDESKASLVFRNYHLGTAGQTTFTINSVDFGIEEIKQQPTITPPIVKTIEEEKAPSALSTSEAKVKIKLNPASGIENKVEFQNNGVIKVITDNNANASYQLESDRLFVQPGQKIKVPYNITVEPGGIMAVSLLNTNRDGWLHEQILKAGLHNDFFEVTVPEREREVSLVFLNYHLGTPGQTIFTINSIDMGNEEAIPQLAGPPESIAEEKVKLNSTGAGQVERHNGKIKVITDNNNWASYQLTSERFDIVPGQKISVPYNVSVEEGGIMSIGLLNTTESEWLNEIVLKAGPNQAGLMEVIVPKNESKASLVFRNYHLGTAGQTTFTINSVDFEQEEIKQQPTASSVLSASESKVKIGLNPVGYAYEIIRNQDGTIKVITDDNAFASYQLESDRLSVQPGQKIKVPYNITVEPGGIMAVSLLNTNRDGWLYEQILKAGPHNDFFEVTIPEGEREVSLVFRNYHLGTPGQTTFTINSINVAKE